MAEPPEGDDAGTRAATDAIAAAIRKLHNQLQNGVGVTDLDEAIVQDAIAAIVKLYARMLERERYFPPFPPRNGEEGVTATEVAVTASEMLNAVQIELFELGMWRTWGGLRAKGS
jgi:hypothetical protein